MLGLVIYLAFSFFTRVQSKSTASPASTGESEDEVPSPPLLPIPTVEALPLPYVHISALFYYPIKSCAAIRVANTREYNRLGLQLDRAWMIVQKTAQKVNQSNNENETEPEEVTVAESDVIDTSFYYNKISSREIPAMQLLTPHIDEVQHELVITCPTLPGECVRVPLLPNTKTESVIAQTTVWDDKVAVFLYSNPAISQFFAKAFPTWKGKLLLARSFEPQQHVRPLPDKWNIADKKENISTALSDGFPFLLASTTSHSHLNSLSTDSSVHILSYRPNIIVSGPADQLKPFEEDYWDIFRVESSDSSNSTVQRFSVCKPCVRCSMPNVDPFTGKRRRTGQPYKVMEEHRRVDKDTEKRKDCVFFGQNIVQLQQNGVLSIGDRIVVEKKKEKFWNPLFMEADD